MASYLTSIIVLVTIINLSGSWTVGAQEFSCPENEEYYKCSLAKCFKTCDNLTKSPPCPSISADCFLPSCECVQDYLRNRDGICVPFQKCENWRPNPMDEY